VPQQLSQGPGLECNRICFGERRPHAKAIDANAKKMKPKDFFRQSIPPRTEALRTRNKKKQEREMKQDLRAIGPQPSASV
jgi:hypothetical protein